MNGGKTLPKKNKKTKKTLKRQNYYNTNKVKLKSLGAIILFNHKGELKKFCNFYHPAIVTKPKALA